MFTSLFCVLKEAKMTDQELHQVFERRLPEIIPWIVYNSQGSDDMIQEGLLGMWAALRKDPAGTNRFLKNNSYWQMIGTARRGKSVDYPSQSFQRRKFSIKIVNTSVFNTEVADYILEDRSLAVDQKVIAKISWERFLKRLSRLEWGLVKARLNDLTTKQICHKLSLTYDKYLLIRKMTLEKFKEAFA
jgi:hypothetical protein